MCAIAGIISPHEALVNRNTLVAMATMLEHRGPDGEGFWVSGSGQVGLAHRRLSIIDLASRAAQPLHYLHYTIVFNGEIYNYVELKQQLQAKGYVFTTGADTEVIPAAFDCWGIQCLHQFDGMFAFALWDEKQQQLILARDRFGEKPLYYHAQYAQRGKFERFVFASEMKALWAAGAPRHLNGTMVLNYITLGYVQNPLKKTATFYNDILSLPPGHHLTIQPQLGKVQMKRWYGANCESINVNGEKVHSPWSMVRGGDNGELKLLREDEAIGQFSSLFTESVERRLRSDVNIGTCLSGGLDSSSIVAACSSLKASHLTHECFTAVFPGFEKDEFGFGKKVATHFGLRQHTVEVTANDWIDNFSTLMYHQEEPLQSSSVLAQFMVYRLAKQHGVTVLLDGQGADEILGGYKKYAPWYLQQLLRTNIPAFKKEKPLLQQNLFLEAWGIANYAAAFFPAKAATRLQQRAVRQQLADKAINTEFLSKYQMVDMLQKPVVNKLEDILYYNTFTQGLQELLRYADRNSMAHSREARLPFLSHQLVEFVFSLPSNYKIRNGFTKWVLRQAIKDKLPKEITWRTDKIGYEPPQKTWMQQPAAIELMMDARKKLVRENVLDKQVLNKPAAAGHAHGRQNSDWRYMCIAQLL